MEPQSPQFDPSRFLPISKRGVGVEKVSPGVSVGPKGSFGKLSPRNILDPRLSPPSYPVRPGLRPTPNQGVTVPGSAGKPPVTIGGEKPNAVKVQPTLPPKPKSKVKLRGGFGLRGGMGAGGGGFPNSLNQ
jgi:hypothetical protein